MLQGRLFSYHDTHLHRLGGNYLQIPINCPYATRVRNYQRDGPMCVDGNQGVLNSSPPISCRTLKIHRLLWFSEGAPNYYPNSFSGPEDNKMYSEYKEKCPVGDIAR